MTALRPDGSRDPHRDGLCRASLSVPGRGPPTRRRRHLCNRVNVSSIVPVTPGPVSTQRAFDCHGKMEPLSRISTLLEKGQ